MSKPGDSDPPSKGAAADAASESVEYVLHDLTELVRRAKRGLRRDVVPLVEALDHGGLLVPLAKSIAGVPVGEVIHAEQHEELTLAPHLLEAGDGTTFVPLFTDSDILRSLEQYLDWTTEGAELEFCTLPARVALDLALQLADGESVMGALINPSDDSELFLQRHELGSLVQGRPIPLVGYVEALPESPDEEVLIAELDEPPDAELIAAIDGCIERAGGVTGYRMQQTFNRERDLEPHPTLTIELAPDQEIDRDALSKSLFEALEGKLPDPGYIDVIFEVPAGGAADDVSESGVQGGRLASDSPLASAAADDGDA